MILISIRDIYLFLLLLFRGSALILMLPLWGERGLPQMVKVALAFGIALCLYPSFQFVDSIPSQPFIWGINALKETLVGLIMGFVVRCAFNAVEFAGQWMANEMGIVRSEIFNPFDEHQNSVLSVVLFYFMGLVFFLTNTHHEVLYGIAKSYEYVNLGFDWKSLKSLEGLVGISSSLFLIGFKIAAPLVTLNFVITFAFAILGKAAPKINVFFISFSVRIFLGLLFIVLSSRLFYGYVFECLKTLPENMLHVLQSTQ